MILNGRVKDGVILLDNGGALPEGTLVQVTPLSSPVGDPLAVIAAMEAAPHLAPDDIAELERVLAAGKRPAAPIDPFAPGPA